MEVKSVSPLEHDNKENIPPFSLSKKPGPNEEKPKCNLVKKKWIRRPLRDVTNFYRATELWGLDPEVGLMFRWCKNVGSSFKDLPDGLDPRYHVANPYHPNGTRCFVPSLVDFAKIDLGPGLSAAILVLGCCSSGPMTRVESKTLFHKLGFDTSTHEELQIDVGSSFRSVPSGSSFHYESNGSDPIHKGQCTLNPKLGFDVTLDEILPQNDVRSSFNVVPTGPNPLHNSSPNAPKLLGDHSSHEVPRVDVGSSLRSVSSGPNPLHNGNPVPSSPPKMRV
ncbi:hypothetical protein SASPL_121689 [Salvia splendens]|uniref:Uncharacterized protein n=1 Tax=Salvia splendens TaxID=180675 RepID=A0A8X8XVG8_SALSN|nr:hypothetical protein SASPL_121689 [Salvia splendens]